jgi:7-carboxy-7-deazaguanine synthase
MKICEVFRSIQGEGKTIGFPTMFIRTSGCNLRCAWCDTAYAMEGGSEHSVQEVLEWTKGEEHICVTGGEPMLQKDCPELLRALADEGKKVVLETNGSLDLSSVPSSDNIVISMDIKCPSSGMHDRMLFDNIGLLREKDQLKFIIEDYVDMNHAISVMEEHSPGCECIFSPLGGMDLEPLAEEVLGRRLRVRVLPQLHKIIWGDRKGV